MIASMIQAVVHGADIINISLGLRLPAPVAFTARPFNSITRATRGIGKLIFASAGNNGENVDATVGRFGLIEKAWHVPCENAGVICVGGLDENSQNRATNSNYGSEEVDIFGPYVVTANATPEEPGTDADLHFGTSFASPFVAGVAALIWASDPSLSADEVSEILFETSHTSPDRTVEQYVNAHDAVLRSLGIVRTPPAVNILSPVGAAVDFFGFDGFDAGRNQWYKDVTLVGNGNDDQDGRLTGRSLEWTTNQIAIQGTDLLGFGETLAVRLYSDSCFGTVHHVTLTGTDADGQGASDSIAITIRTFC